MSPKTKHFARDNSCATPQVTSRPLPSDGKEIVEELPMGTIEFKPVILSKMRFTKKPKALEDVITACRYQLLLSMRAGGLL